jgi:uncharacterized protein (UPF0332 family)
MADLKTELFELVEVKELDALFGTSEVVEKTLKRAELNIATAQHALPADQSAALALAYDAARKALSALLLQLGYRVHERGGSHGTFVRITRLSCLEQDVWSEFEQLKKMRNKVEYGAFQEEYSLDFVSQAIAQSRLMVADARRAISAL